MSTRTRNLLATATYTLKVVNDGATGPQGPQGSTGPQGPQGPQGEAKDYYDGTFMDGKKYWSTNYNDTYAQPGSNVVVTKEATSKIGGNILQIQNDTWLYAKNKIAIEQNKIYKFTFRVRQIQDPLNDASKNKVYAGATTFNAEGNKLSPNNGTYFIVSSQGITVANGWKEYTAYMSTTARSAIVNSQNQTLCPAVKAFDAGTVAIKPMFIVNYSGGNGIAQVDYLTMEDFTETWNLLNKLNSKLDDDFQSVFDTLTSDGTMQGVFMTKDGHLYINGQYIEARKLKVINNLNTPTFEVTADGNVNINALSLKIGGIIVPDENKVGDTVDKAVDGIQVGYTNLARETRRFTLDSTRLKGWYNANGFVITESDLDENCYVATISASGLTANSIKSMYSSYVMDVKQGDTFTFSVWMKVTNTTAWDYKYPYIFEGYDSTNTRVQYEDVLYNASNTNKPTFTNGQWVRFSSVHTVTNANVKSIGMRLSLFRNGQVAYKLAKIEKGNKLTDWSDCPDDINFALDNKPNGDELIETINSLPQTETSISATKINLKGAVTFESLKQENNEIGNAFVRENNVTLIDGGQIKTKSVVAEKIDIYELLVKRRKNTGTAEQPVWVEEDVPTFNVSSTGNITASGTFKSFNFKESTNIEDMEGWMISEDGNSIFNNTIIRGRVELPTAGITNEGRENLIPYTDFSVSSNMSKFKTYGTSVQLTYSSADGGYVMCRNTTLAVADGGCGMVTPTLRTGLRANKKYTLSFKARSSSNTGELDYIYILSNVSGVSNQNIGKVTINAYDTWASTQSITFTPTVDYPKATILIGFRDAVITGNTNQKGFAIKEIRLVEDDKESMWFENSPVRFYAGTDHANRDEAPFRVLQDGSIFAKEGTFGGTFTGNLKIGNIEIVDEVGTTANPIKGIIRINNDTNTKAIVQVGEESSWFNSPVHFGDGDKAKINIEPESNKINIKTGASIVLDSGSSSLAINNTSTGSHILLGSDVKMQGSNNNLEISSNSAGPINLKVGNFSSTSTSDDASLDVDGNLSCKNNFTMSGLRITYTTNGVDFIVSN